MAGRGISNGARLGFEETLWQAAGKMLEAQIWGLKMRIRL